MNKVFETFDQAVADIPDGAVVMIGNFAGPGGTGLTLDYDDHRMLFDNRQVKKVIASFPFSTSASKPSAAEKQIRAGEVELEIVPRGLDPFGLGGACCQSSILQRHSGGRQGELPVAIGPVGELLDDEVQGIENLHFASNLDTKLRSVEPGNPEDARASSTKCSPAWFNARGQRGYGTHTGDIDPSLHVVRHSR